jgi:peptidylprolyl isomerase
VRKTTAAFSALALSTIVLTGCSASTPTFDGAACDRDSSAALKTSVKVSGEFGSPRVSVEVPVHSGHLSYADLITGDGRAITDDGQEAILARVLVNGTTGQAIDAQLKLWSPESAGAELPGVDKALECATEGSRIVVAIPASDLPEGLAPQIGLDAKDNLLAVYDVHYTTLAKADGSAVFNDAPGLPSVVRAPDGRPGVIIPDVAAPKKTVTETLLQGDHEKVGDGTALIRSTSVGWSSRSVDHTTWDSTLTGTDGLPAEVVEAVADSRVGSQLMVVVPSESGDDATVYVVDVLGVIPEELMGQ